MYEGAIQDLIDELGRLPGIGPKSAQRIAFHVLSADPADVKRLAAALQRVKEQVRFCTTCFNVAEAEQCRICRDPRRTDDVLCVVEEPKDVVAIERTGEFRGRYHVLGGAINPLEGTDGDHRQSAGERAAGRWRPGVRGRDHAGPGLRGPASGVTVMPAGRMTVTSVADVT
jgi:recombination protein RecR